MILFAEKLNLTTFFSKTRSCQMVHYAKWVNTEEDESFKQTFFCQPKKTQRTFEKWIEKGDEELFDFTFSEI